MTKATTIRYQEMTGEDKDREFGRRTLGPQRAYYVITDGGIMGYVYARPLTAAGSLWRATGATQAWVAWSAGSVVMNGEHGYFASRKDAAAAIAALARKAA